MFSGLIGITQFKIPFNRFTNQRGLIAHFLAIADRRIPAAEMRMFTDGRAPAKNDYRYITIGKINNPACGISQPDIRMHHHSLHFTGCQIVSMGHANRGVFMRANNKFRNQTPFAF